MPSSLAAEVLGRAPEIARSGIVSWGRLGREVIAELLSLDNKPSEAEESRDEIRLLLDGGGSASLQWCLYYREGKQRGE
jgi:hypothetical protein